ncbi:hypothetical protein [Paenarthrobacter sp. JL.01a]|uniref:hypothetical protein n=1 Tax=Paenarthrobacter sp. JL.01a TaxID=2979324 RepID=UPI0021C85CDC|nr:hypothetical protein [Paenarthrobacter sp. JL.01a]UXM92838.1 hypothetical protein N5P29_05805 [Paenarthrobacter sp. JL.01a]
MGVEDSIRKATENAMEDLAGTSGPVKKDNVPEPGEKDDDIQVYSSISEGSNAMDEDLPPKEDRPTGRRRSVGEPYGGQDSTNQGDDVGTQRGSQDATAASAASGDVAGPAGLPSGDPDDLRADPSEGGGDPSTSMGRG